MEEGSRRIAAEFRKLLRWWLHSMKVEGLELKRMIKSYRYFYIYGENLAEFDI